MSAVESTAVRMTRSQARKLATPARESSLSSNAIHHTNLCDISAAPRDVELNKTDDQNEAQSVDETVKQRVSFGIAIEADLNAVAEDSIKAGRASYPRIATPFNKTPLPVDDDEEDEDADEVVSLFIPPKCDVDTQTDKSLGQLKREIKAAVESKAAAKMDLNEKSQSEEDALDLVEMMSKKMVLNGVPKATGTHTRFDESP